MEPVISSREPLRRSDLTISDIRAHSDLPTHKDGTVTLVPQTELDHVQVDAIRRGSYRRQLQVRVALTRAPWLCVSGFCIVCEHFSEISLDEQDLLEEAYYTSVQACLHSWYHPQSDEDVCTPSRSCSCHELFGAFYVCISAPVQLTFIPSAHWGIPQAWGGDDHGLPGTVIDVADHGALHHWRLS